MHINMTLKRKKKKYLIPSSLSPAKAAVCDQLDLID